MTGRERPLIECRGSPAITASHDKTIEVTLDPAITPRATCVVGVGATVDWDRLLAMRGPVTLSLSVGRHRDEVKAEINPFFRPGPRLVVRTSRFRAEDTLAVGADKAARALDRELVSAMRDPAARLVVDVAPDGRRRAEGLLCVLTPDASGLAGGADLVLDAGGGAGGAVRAGRGRSGRGRGDALDRAGPVLDEGGVVFVVIPPVVDIPGCLPGLADRADRRRATVAGSHGIGVLVAALALAGVGPAEPVRISSLAGGTARSAPGRRAEIAAALAGPLATVWSGPAVAVSKVLDAIGRLAPGQALCLAAHEHGPGEGERIEPVAAVRRGAAVELAPLLPAGGRRVARSWALLVLAPERAAGGGGGDVAGPLLRALIDEGVTPRTLWRALSRLPGHEEWTYERLIALRRGDGRS